MSTLPIASLDDLTQFSTPAYTYILKFPYVGWKGVWVRVQRALGGIRGDALDDPSVYIGMPGPDSPIEQTSFLETHGPDSSYHLNLSHCAHMAAYSVFSVKQGRAPPVASIFVQSEIGERDLHLHLVLGGQGLNKYSAKAFRHQLQYKFCENLITVLERHVNEGTTSDPEMCSVLIKCLSKAKNEEHAYCTILQYKSRSGDLYACRVDPVEFICNYLLRKNLKYYTCMDPDKATQHIAYFDATSKTYAVTLANGKWVPTDCRKQWLNILRHNVIQKNEPIFAGEMFDVLPKVPESSWKIDMLSSQSKITKRETLMIDCMNRCEQNYWLTYEDLVNGCADLVVMLECQSGGNKLIEQILSMVHIKMTQKYTALSYILAKYDPIPFTTDNKVWKLLTLQGYNPWQFGHWLLCVLDKKAGKQNTINFYGPASTGKTNLAKAIVNAVQLYGCVNHQNKNFVFNDCTAKLICWWEECIMTTDWVEQAKCIMGGTQFRIDRKHKDSHLLPQTPLIISTNHNIYEVTGGNTTTHVHSMPLRERVVQFNFMKQLESTFGEIEPTDVVALLQVCYKKYSVSLSDFHRTWNIKTTPNDFPLTVICSNHTQDLIVFESGLCGSCGGYYPLETWNENNCQNIEKEDITGEILNHNDISYEEFEEWITNFDFSLLDSPETPNSTTPSGKRTSSDETINSPPKKQRKTKHKVLIDWSSQPSTSAEQYVYETYEQEIKSEEPESQSTGLTRSEWGERLGIIPQGMDQEPIVLHCFETIDWEEDNTDACIQ
uniref:Initiator protein NS1 n=1 Tax=Canine minute virus TaxID=329639 RepID=A0A3G2KUP1_9VIRU|nr:NS1 protein [Canine minute virus]